MSGWKRSWSPVAASDPPPIDLKISKSTNVVNIDDLPDSLLVEILCRQPSKELVFQCKCVSKRWCNLISDPYLIGRFVYLQRYHNKQTLIARSLIDKRGEEFPTPRTTSSSNLLAPLFKRLMSFYGLEKEPCVVGTSNDLVLCCRTEYKQRDYYYICNPYTRQWVALPPTTQCDCRYVQVGLVCDRYYEDEDTSGSSSTSVKINENYRCKVVRIVPQLLSASPSHKNCFSKYIVEVFSFETGEWRESIVSTPRSIEFAPSSVVYNGLLYWTYWAFVPSYKTGLIGLVPFGNASNGDDDHYEFRLFDAVEHLLDTPWLCVRRGCLQMWDYSSRDYEFMVWELTDDLGSADKFYLKHVSVYRVDFNILKYNAASAAMLALDPNDEDIFYLQADSAFYTTYYVMHNIRTRTWSKIDSTRYFEDKPFDHIPIFRSVLPWWPTPLPRLPLVDELPILALRDQFV